jgi:hypothetical protein
VKLILSGLVTALSLSSCKGCAKDAPPNAAAPDASGSSAPYLPSRASPNDDSLAPPSVTESVLATLKPRLNACYRSASRENIGLQGDVTFHVTIDGSGHTKDVSVLSDTGLGLPLIGCLTDVLKSAEFPPPPGGAPTAFNVPLSFHPPRPKLFDAGR